MDKEYYNCLVCGGLPLRSDLLPDHNTELACYLTHQNDVSDPGYQAFTYPITSYILEHFEPTDEGLDFGSGTGPVISSLLHENGYSIKPYDPFFAPNPELLKSHAYDYIVACEVIEHFHNPHLEFIRLRNMLRPGGKLVCMTHIYDDSIEFNNWYYRRDQTHVFIYRDQTLEFIKKQFDFSDVMRQNRLIVFSS